MEKRGRGKPRRWPDGDSFYTDAKAYAELCREDKRLCNVAGFCVYADITRETFYAQKNYYPDAFARVENLIEDEAINCTFVHNKIVAMYLNNKCGYVNRTESENINVNVGVDAADRALLDRVSGLLEKTKSTEKAEKTRG